MTKTRRTRTVTRNEFSKIDRIWAHLGMVWIQPKEGHKVSLTPGEAARRAIALNDSLLHDTSKVSREVTLRLVERVRDVAREALHQQESSPNKETDLVINALKSATTLQQRLARLNPMDQGLYRKMTVECPTLDGDEIVAIVSSDKFTQRQKEDLLKAVNKERIEKLLQTKKLTDPI